MEEYTEAEFNEYLDEVFPTYTIAGVTLYPSTILKATDPIAYRQAYLDMQDSYEENDEDDSDDECEGHESLNGDMMGESVFCDGSCKTSK